MKAPSVVRAVLDFDVAEYVSTTRAVGRHHLDPELRNRMAELYLDLRDALHESDAVFDRQELRVLRFAELALQSEWKLADPSGAASGAGLLNTVSGPRGKRYQPYANVRLLNQILGTRRGPAMRPSSIAADRHCGSSSVPGWSMNNARRMAPR